MQELINTIQNFFATHTLSSVFSGLGAAIIVFLFIAAASERGDDE